MRPPSVVEIQLPADRGSGVADGVVGAQVDLLVFDRLPEPLDEDIVPPGALAVHRDLDLLGQQHFGEVGAGELAAIEGQKAFDPTSGGDAVSRPCKRSKSFQLFRASVRRL